MFGTRKLGKKLKNKSVRTMMHLKWVFWDILGQLGTFWDNSEDFLTSLEHLDCFPSHFRPFSPIIGQDIFRHFLTFWDILRHFGTFRDNSEDILTSWDRLDCFPSHFRPFSSIIGSFEKTRSGRTDRRTDGRTDGPTDGPTDRRTDRPSYRDAWTHLKMCFT